MLKAVDFFCGGGGMSLGLSQAGIEVLAGIDNDESVQSTYEANHNKSQFLNRDISTLPPSELQSILSLERKDNNLLLVGCSPCQYWSLINTTKVKSKKTAFLLSNFYEFVKHLLPGYILIENVPGLSKKRESPINDFKEAIQSMGYSFTDGVLDCNSYGVPQKRHRYVLIASRLGNISLPKNRLKKKPVLRDAIGDYKYFEPVPSGALDKSAKCHSTAKLSSLNVKRIQATPHDGGTRLSWKNNEELQLKAYINRDDIFKDVYGRLFWDKPAPTITTKFISYSNGRFGHPEQDRALSIREGASIQSFPRTYKIKSESVTTAARIIGNAVPPKFAKALGREIMRSHREQQ
ncbi:DNA cytosine methyltransferase [Sessilibacter corallicola]|uniref:DNA (cytosine-5-)-methyltransferase n=1 Tax=Sessilibacter corallicola TaxID=2904075 RepID=A0ABQ0A667_9GAMM